MLERHGIRLLVVSRSVRRAAPVLWPAAVTVGSAFGLLLVLLVLDGIVWYRYLPGIDGVPAKTVVFERPPDAVEPNEIEAALPVLPYA